MNFSILVVNTAFADFYLGERWADDVGYPKWAECLPAAAAQSAFADAVDRIRRYGALEGGKP